MSKNELVLYCSVWRHCELEGRIKRGEKAKKVDGWLALLVVCCGVQEMGVIGLTGETNCSPGGKGQNFILDFKEFPKLSLIRIAYWEAFKGSSVAKCSFKTLSGKQLIRDNKIWSIEGKSSGFGTGVSCCIWHSDLGTETGFCQVNNTGSDRGLNKQTTVSCIEVDRLTWLCWVDQAKNNNIHVMKSCVKLVEMKRVRKSSFSGKVYHFHTWSRCCQKKNMRK